MGEKTILDQPCKSRDQCGGLDICFDGRCDQKISFLLPTSNSHPDNRIFLALRGDISLSFQILKRNYCITTSPGGFARRIWSTKKIYEEPEFEPEFARTAHHESSSSSSLISHLNKALHISSGGRNK
ncbi:hypothetical protein QR680_011972 [Steinernema hermaphroditum]|uniref:Uncharacterized protein n=1 Tax=Steinernema hermaphroditum TaxID=289476 RepID=A0AA39I0E7_9BILA|nr:hypothetical protein QR680_011972 [Steinernema hermaphroditum]